MSTVSCYAGRLKTKLEFWRTVTRDKYILGIIKGYEIEFANDPTPNSLSVTPNLPNELKNETTILVNRLLSIGAIVQVEACQSEFISCIFPVPKSNGSYRLVMNLKPLNKFIQYNHFKMEDWRTVVHLLEKGMYMAKVDLQDAYHLVPMGTRSRKYLRFIWNEKRYEYVCLPFGLSTAPRVFTKLMKVVMQHLRKQNFISVYYLDDLLLFGNTVNECRDNVKATVCLLEGLGFIISSKSELEPKTRIEYLGLEFCSLSLTVSLPQRKKEKILQLCKTLLIAKLCTIQKLAEFIGSLVSACPGVKNGQLYTRHLEKEKMKALKASSFDYSKILTLSDKAINEITWWSLNISNNNPIKSFQTDMIIFSDASLYGWGASMNNLHAKGKWNDTQKMLHINCLELIAVGNALKAFCSDHKNCSILLRVDNKTAISYINKLGGCRSEHLHEIAKGIIEWCNERNLFISATYIKSKDNVVADSLSRGESYNSEWMLGKTYYDIICGHFGVPEIDLFASYLNYKCKNYYSFLPDPECIGIDAFSFSWRNMHAYAFPPFSIITKVLQKIREDEATVTLIVPNWPGQPWYPVLQKLRKSDPIFLGPNRNLLLCPYSRKPHPIKSLQLMAVSLCGKR